MHAIIRLGNSFHTPFFQPLLQLNSDQSRSSAMTRCDVCGLLKALLRLEVATLVLTSLTFLLTLFSVMAEGYEAILFRVNQYQS